MFVHITFSDGSNPYIAMSNKSLWFMVKHYCLTFTTPEFLNCEGENQVLSVRKLTEREKNKALLREFAIDYQLFCADYSSVSMDHLIMWSAFFEEYGKRFGLLREFRENGIC